MMIALIASSVVSKIDCGDPTEDRFRGRLTDERICATINQLHDSLPDSIPQDEKCSRYAFLLSKLTHDGSVYRSTVSDAMTVEKSWLVSFQERLNKSITSSLMMSAIDKYRLIGLAPAFIDLLDCLRLFDTPYTQAFLYDKELKVTENLYKQILSKPDQTIHISELDVKKFQPSQQKYLKFKANLINLLGAHIREDKVEGMSDSDQTVMADLLGASESIQYSRYDSRPVDWLKEQEKFRHRARERSRLNSRRLRLISPESTQGQSQTQYELRRIFEHLDRQAPSLPWDRPVEFDRKRIQNRRRESHERYDRRQRHQQQMRVQRIVDLHKKQQLEQVRLHSQLAMPQSHSDPGQSGEQQFVNSPEATGPDFTRLFHADLTSTLHSPLNHMLSNNGRGSEHAIDDLTHLYMSDPSGTYPHEKVIYVVDCEARNELSGTDNIISTSENLVHCPAQPNDTDIVRQYLLDEPQTSEAAIDPMASSSNT